MSSKRPEGLWDLVLYEVEGIAIFMILLPILTVALL